ncbi:MAG: GNAT family N-acetyltransferase [Chloroflexota bacterium]
MTDITIRSATPADVESAHAVEAAAFPAEFAASRESVEKRIAAFSQGFFVAEVDGQIVGIINSGAWDSDSVGDAAFKGMDGHNSNGNHVVIFSVAVLPQYQRRGIAAQLLHHFITAMGEAGKVSVLLICQPELVPYYEQFGFVNRGESGNSHGGAHWYEMALKLT